jgi:hypothetical protein
MAVQLRDCSSDENESGTASAAASTRSSDNHPRPLGRPPSNEFAKWEALYSQLDRANAGGKFEAANNLFQRLLDSQTWGVQVLHRSWSQLPNGSVREWNGSASIYPREYRLIDGMREGWICLLMDFCKWDHALRLTDVYLADNKCVYLTGKAQVALNKLHCLLESRRMQEAMSFYTALFEGHGGLGEILKIIEKSFPFQWHYSLARISFLNKDYCRAQHHSEAACIEIAKTQDKYEEPLQARLWVFMIRAYTRGLVCVTSKDASGLLKILDLWESTVCDLDRKSAQTTLGLCKNSVFGRIKFVEFLMDIHRACSELDIRSYDDIVNDPNMADLVSLNKLTILRIRTIANELIQKEGLSVEVTHACYSSLLDNALTETGYLGTSLQSLVDNWALVIDAGPIGNEARYANHCDDPNAALALGHSDAGRVRVLKALKPIRKNDEITVHYGVNYWEATHETRSSAIYQKYNERTSMYAMDSKYPFVFYDGIVSDVNGSGLPPVLLLESMGKTGTCQEAFDMEASCQRKGLRVEACPEGHAAYPGKRLIADRNFSVGEQICLYAGVLIKMPVDRLQLRDTDYLSTVCNSTAGPYGFELEDVQANDGCVFKKSQPGLPCPPTASPDGRIIPNTYPRADLSGIEDIKGLGPQCTQFILTALQDEQYHDMLRRLLKRLHKLPDKQWKTHAQVEIRKVFNAFRKRIDALIEEVKCEEEDKENEDSSKRRRDELRELSQKCPELPPEQIWNHEFILSQYNSDI